MLDQFAFELGAVVIGPVEDENVSGLEILPE